MYTCNSKNWNKKLCPLWTRWTRCSFKNHIISQKVFNSQLDIASLNSRSSYWNLKLRVTDWKLPRNMRYSRNYQSVRSSVIGQGNPLRWTFTEISSLYPYFSSDSDVWSFDSSPVGRERYTGRVNWWPSNWPNHYRISMKCHVAWRHHLLRPEGRWNDRRSDPDDRVGCVPLRSKHARSSTGRWFTRFVDLRSFVPKGRGR